MHSFLSLVETDDALMTSHSVLASGMVIGHCTWIRTLGLCNGAELCRINQQQYPNICGYLFNQSSLGAHPLLMIHEQYCPIKFMDLKLDWPILKWHNCTGIHHCGSTRWTEWLCREKFKEKWYDWALSEGISKFSASLSCSLLLVAGSNPQKAPRINGNLV